MTDNNETFDHAGPSSLDLGRTPIRRLFLSYLGPTLLSMLSSAVLNVADGAFVGRGVGSDALAAINVASPVFLITTGIAIMLGSGASVLGAIRLSQKDSRGAGALVTNAFTASGILMALICAGIFVFAPALNYAFGGSDVLCPYTVDYLLHIIPGLFCLAPVIIGGFVIRLDGSPRYAMWANLVPTMLNILLDYVFIFKFRMGISGAASATSLSIGVGLLMVVGYFVFMAKDVRLVRLSHSKSKQSKRVGGYGLRGAFRSVWQMAQVGLPTFFGELAISVLFVVGNVNFIKYLGEDGVAAFSVSCYLMPAVFMFANAIAQSSMPIISYNYGQKSSVRLKAVVRLSLVWALCSSVVVMGATMLFAPQISGVFLPPDAAALAIVGAGLPLFAVGYVAQTLNVVAIGCLQSVVRKKAATAFMILRGYVFVIPAFFLLPRLMGTAGLWLAVPVAETLTLLCLAGWWLLAGKPQ